MFFRSSQKDRDVCLVLDIGNASFAGSLVLFKKGSVPESLFTVRVPFAVSEHAHPDKLQSILLKQLKEVLQMITKRGFEHAYFKQHKKNISRALCVYASPWYISKTKKILISNTKSFVVTKKFIDDVLKKEVDLFETELADGTHGEEFKAGIVVMEKTIVNTKVNGYAVSDLFSQVTNKLELTLYLGIGSKNIVSLVEREINKHFHLNDNEIIHHSFPLVTYSVVNNIFPHENNYIICDVTGEVTDVTLVEGGMIGETVTFPSGKFLIVRNLMKVMDVPADVAQSFLNLYNKGSAGKEVEEKILQVLNDSQKEWSIYLEDAFSSLKKMHSIPLKLYLTADTDVIKTFIDFIKTPQVDATANWRKDVVIVPIISELLKKHYTPESQINFDEFIAINSIFFGIFQ